jgi:hypothetical protein
MKITPAISIRASHGRTRKNGRGVKYYTIETDTNDLADLDEIKVPIAVHVKPQNEYESPSKDQESSYSQLTCKGYGLDNRSTGVLNLNPKMGPSSSQKNYVTNSPLRRVNIIESFKKPVLNLNI